MVFRITVVALLILTSVARAQQPQNRGQAWATSHEGKAILTLNGEIGPSMMAELESALADLPADTREIMIILDSPGGEVATGKRMIELLRAQKQLGRRITTEVGNGKKCASMCVPVYMMGDARRAAPTAAFMFHAIHLNVFVRISLPGQERETQELLESVGIKREYVARLLEEGVLSSFTGYWVTPRDLVEQGSNVVTDVLSHFDPSAKIEVGGVTIGF